MPLFNVVQPCAVNGLHYIHPTEQPIEIGEDVAADLLADGKIEPYPKPAGFFVERIEPGAFKASFDHGRFIPPAVLASAKPETDDNKPRLVAWLLNNGTDLSGPELNRLTKAELWKLINPVDPDGEAD